MRGGLFGVVDLASFVSGNRPPPKSDMARSDSRLVALNAALEINCALLIDKLSGLRNQEAFVDFSPRATGAPEFFGNHYVDIQGTSWQEINLQQLAQQANFLTIGA